MFLVFYSKWVGWKCNAFKSYPSDLWQICTTTTKGFGEGSRDWNRTFDLWLTRLYCPKSKNLKVESWLRRSTRNCRLLKAQLRTATYGMYVKWKKKMFSGFNLKITTHQCKVFFFCPLKNVFYRYNWNQWNVFFVCFGKTGKISFIMHLDSKFWYYRCVKSITNLVFLKNVQLLGGFHGSGYNLTTDKDHMHKTLITYIRELNEANIDRYRKMSQRMNKFLLKVKATCYTFSRLIKNRIKIAIWAWLTLYK